MCLLVQRLSSAVFFRESRASRWEGILGLTRSMNVGALLHSVDSLYDTFSLRYPQSFQTSWLGRGQCSVGVANCNYRALRGGCRIDQGQVILSPHPSLWLRWISYYYSQEITSSRHHWPKPAHLYRALTFFGKNIVASEGEDWKRYRKVTAPAFSDVSTSLSTSRQHCSCFSIAEDDLNLLSAK